MSGVKVNSKEVFSNVSKERVEMSEKLFSILVKALNNIHRSNYSDRFWRILLGGYVKAVIYHKYLLENKTLSLEPSNNNGIEVQKEKILSFSKLKDLSKKTRSIGQYGSLVSKLKSGTNIGTGFHYPNALPPEIDVYLSEFHVFLKQRKVNSELRNISIDYSGHFTETFENNVVKLIPKLFIEHFDALMNRIELINPRTKIFHLSQFSSNFIRFMVAKYVENGAKLYYYQHGGFYGEYDYHSAHYYESSIADQFMTWGWKIKDNDVACSAFRLEKFRKNYKQHQKKSFDLLLVYPNIYHKNVGQIKDMSNEFFSGINRKKYPFICARPRPMSKFRRKKALNFIKDKVSFIDSGYGEMSSVAAKSKLIIQMKYPSTNLFECLYLNLPTVAILENEIPSAIVKPYYDYFLEKKMFHRSMKSLVDHLNQTDIDLWWKNLINEPKYKKFKYEFLRKVEDSRGV